MGIHRSFSFCFCSLSSASYVFAQKPPSTDTWVTRRLILKQWGEPTDSDDDIYLLADLDEFSSTDFGSLGEHSCGEKLPGVHVLDPRKTHIGALHSVIPQVCSARTTSECSDLLLPLATYPSIDVASDPHFSSCPIIYQNKSHPNSSS